jgi:hypothetical protein
MNGRQEDFELELKAMLTVDPDTDLQARIRARSFATPGKRTPWFAMTCSLGAVLIMIVLAVSYTHPKLSEKRPSPTEVAVNNAVVSPPPGLKAVPPRRGSLMPQRPKQPPKQPIAVRAVTVTTTDMVLDTGDIELPRLTGLELTGSLEPIPQAPVSIARLEPINIEPIILTVPNLGVNE